MPRAAAATKLKFPKPLIPSLSVKGYKCLSDLQVERLGHVNLIVGSNGVGKTTFLEAVRLVASGAAPEDVAEILLSRDELPTSYDIKRNEIDKGWFLSELFADDDPVDEEDRRILLTAGSGTRLALWPKIGRWADNEEVDRSSGSIFRRRFDLAVEFNDKTHTLSADELIDFAEFMSHMPQPFRWKMRRKRYKSGAPATYVSSHGLDGAILSLLWSNIALTDDEDEVLKALQIITPDLEKISFIGTDAYDSGPVPMIRLAGSSRPTTLRSAGDGMTRLLGIALALVNARDGVLLVDEIENGIHYAAQEKLWRLIAGTARRLNVQVFATTHSFDCIEAFAKVATAAEDVEGRLIKLHRGKARIEAIEFDESELATITKGRIEVR